MQDDWPLLLAGAGMASLAPVVWRLRNGWRGTTLESAWPSAAIAWISWLVVPIVTVAPSPLVVWRDVMWYVAAVLALVPPIAVLGARRPTARVWTWFVLVPLVLVFTWPLAAALRQEGNPAAFSPEGPVLAGYLLVLFMGAGNYLGLRFSLAALIWMTGLALVVLPLCPATAKWALEPAAGRLYGTLCLVAAGWIADRQVARGGDKRSTGPALNRVWRDFRDLFGSVHSLVAAVLLSALVLVAIFQQAAEIIASKWLRALSLVWIAQNVALIASVLLRLKLYVDAYQLSELRVYVGFFLLLVATGFGLLAWRILRGKALAWLLFANALATFALFFIVQFLDVARWVADYNVARWQQDPRRTLDVDYLESLGPPAYRALIAVAETPNRPEAHEAFQKAQQRKEIERVYLDNLNWRSWQQREIQNARLLLGHEIRTRPL